MTTNNTTTQSDVDAIITRLRQIHTQFSTTCPQSEEEAAEYIKTLPQLTTDIRQCLQHVWPLMLLAYVRNPVSITEYQDGMKNAELELPTKAKE